MPTLYDVEAYLNGVLLLARKRTDGFAWLDLSADGFWRSFWSILYALPALSVSWASYRNAYLAHVEGADAGAGFVLRLAFIDVATWVLPLVVIGLIARPIGVERHFPRFVVATNWLGTLSAYALALPSVLRMVLPGGDDLVLLASIAVFFLVVFLLFRITRLSFDGDASSATFVTIVSIVVSLALSGLMQRILGVAG
ncbi:hypothetical protein [Pararhizobium mangrovi]|uniref:Transporter n=1 Tax=Pararhizobium mangrovi TaxID=2590452 RepID=A0A506UA08_9HYPH|nr:hypothetical protein [Pararhizobium mangrovi]TPW28657.1 hypothetical protein FJU11_08765 [Pararhizobium mangrovi]